MKEKKPEKPTLPPTLSDKERREAMRKDFNRRLDAEKKSRKA